MQNEAKEAAAVYQTQPDGTRVLEGHEAVDPSGHLVMIAKDNDLPDDHGWHWATRPEIEHAQQTAAAIRIADEQTAPGGPLK